MMNFLHRHRNSNADSRRSRRLSLDRCLVQSLRFTVPAFRNEDRARKTETTTTTQNRARRRAFEQICLLKNGGLIGVWYRAYDSPYQHSETKSEQEKRNPRPLLKTEHAAVPSNRSVS